MFLMMHLTMKDCVLIGGAGACVVGIGQFSEQGYSTFLVFSFILDVAWH